MKLNKKPSLDFYSLAYHSGPPQPQPSSRSAQILYSTWPTTYCIAHYGIRQPYLRHTTQTSLHRNTYRMTPHSATPYLSTSTSHPLKKRESKATSMTGSSPFSTHPSQNEWSKGHDKPLQWRIISYSAHKRMMNPSPAPTPNASANSKQKVVSKKQSSFSVGTSTHVHSPFASPMTRPSPGPHLSKRRLRTGPSHTTMHQPSLAD